MGHGGDIVITDTSDGEEYHYDNYRGEAIVHFDLVRIRATGRFPVLKIFFWNEKVPGRCFIGSVHCPILGLSKKWPILLSKYPNSRERECIFDMNEFHEQQVDFENVITLRIFTYSASCDA